MKSDKGTIWRGSSEFTAYEVAEEQYNGRPARLLFSGEREAVQSGLALDDNTDLLFDYNQRFLEVCGNLRPARILLIGGGAMTLPTALLKADEHTLLDVIERDPLLGRLAQQFFGFSPNARLNLYNGDGRVFLDTTMNRYDLILVDAFSHLSIPESLSTLEAVRAMQLALNPGGHVVVNIVSPYYGMGARIIRRQMAAYAQVFDQIEVFAADASETGWRVQNLVLIATDKKSPVPFRSSPLPPLDISADTPRYDV